MNVVLLAHTGDDSDVVVIGPWDSFEEAIAVAVDAHRARPYLAATVLRVQHPDAVSSRWPL